MQKCPQKDTTGDGCNHVQEVGYRFSLRQTNSGCLPSAGIAGQTHDGRCREYGYLTGLAGKFNVGRRENIRVKKLVVGLSLDKG